MLSRRSIIIGLSSTALAGTLATRSRAVSAADKTVKIGISLPFTGADAHDAELIKDGAMLAFDEADAAGGVGGYKVEVLQLDDGTATAGQYDPAQAATNARKMVSDSTVVAAIGPQMSGSGKAMSPILSQGGLATITPSSTNPDITNPKFAGQYRPQGKAVYFRTVTTDAYQGPNMANFFADTLKVKAVYVLDDSGAYGVGVADTFQAQAKKRGMKVLGRDQLNPKEADYATTLTKIKSLNPDGLYYGGVAQAGVKLVKQSYDILPSIVKGGGDGVYGAEILKGAGFPAAAGWYATIAAPNVLENPDAASWIERFSKKYGKQPDNYSITAYDAALVILDAVKRVAASGKEVTREAVRDAIQQSHVKTLQGEIAFDANGDIANRVVSVFQITRNDKYPLDDVLHQYKYVGVAPASS
ncbi:MAG TPA: branched-chain amino acid ABC transporter substrate-binding protein [Stellaceae bacterium]|jgi:branched-chain amino acid transport system substrate-binding protein|nr:branched-chain amino acid ABC transporter substrate-binding protein [Stellaceae bacterium]